MADRTPYFRASYDAVETTPAAADAADDDGLAAQRRLVALLDRREERVEVEVQHGRDLTHGRNLAVDRPR